MPRASQTDGEEKRPEVKNLDYLQVYWRYTPPWTLVYIYMYVQPTF